MVNLRVFYLELLFQYGNKIMHHVLLVTIGIRFGIHIRRLGINVGITLLIFGNRLVSVGINVVIKRFFCGSNVDISLVTIGIREGNRSETSNLKERHGINFVHKVTLVNEVLADKIFTIIQLVLLPKLMEFIPKNFLGLIELS